MADSVLRKKSYSFALLGVQSLVFRVQGAKRFTLYTLRFMFTALCSTLSLNLKLKKDQGVYRIKA